MQDTKDNFSSQSDIYASHRPGYPEALFDWIYEHCKAFHTAWDCATGNGQAAIKLAAKFQMTYATDLSIKQLGNAHKSSNIIYQNERAEQPSFADNSFDLITVAQSLHWFNHELFFDAVKRVAKSDALFAAWGYQLPRVNTAINAIIDNFHTTVVGPYWDAERKHVDNKYASIEIPFKELPCPAFSISYNWTAQHMIGYLNSWSAVQHYKRNNNVNPVSLIEDELTKAWELETLQEVTFPIFMRAVYIQK